MLICYEYVSKCGRKNTGFANRKNTLKSYLKKKTNDCVLDVLRHSPNGQIETYDDCRGTKTTEKYLYQNLTEDHIESFSDSSTHLVIHYSYINAPNFF